MKLADRLSTVAPSATLALTEKALQMKAAGRDVVGLTAGEPDASPAPHIIAAIEKALADGYTRYTPVPGLPAVREAIARPYAERGRGVGKDNVVISTGAKQTVFNAAMAVLSRGDEAITLAPYWVSYADIVRIADGVPVVVKTRAEDGFAIDSAALEAAFSKKTRLLLLNSPSNPTGAVYDEATMTAVAEVLRKFPDVWVVADEIYDRFTYDGVPFVSLLDVAPDLADRTLVVNGCSKTYAMTGLRIGWGVGPIPLVKAIVKLQGQSTSNACAPVQLAAKAAIEGDQQPVADMLARFDERRRFVVEQLGRMQGVSCPPPKGAFYAFPHVGGLLDKRLPDGEPVGDVDGLCRYLLERYAVVVVPGTPFGAPEHLRLSYAADMETLQKGLERMAEAFDRLE